MPGSFTGSTESKASDVSINYSEGDSFSYIESKSNSSSSSSSSSISSSHSDVLSDVSDVSSDVSINHRDGDSISNLDDHHPSDEATGNEQREIVGVQGTPPSVAETFICDDFDPMPDLQEDSSSRPSSDDEFAESIDSATDTVHEFVGETKQSNDASFDYRNETTPSSSPCNRTTERQRQKQQKKAERRRRAHRRFMMERRGRNMPFSCDACGGSTNQCRGTSSECTESAMHYLYGVRMNEEETRFKKFLGYM